MSKETSKNKPKIKLHDLLEYARRSYANTVAEKLTGKTNLEVNWNEGHILKVDNTKKKRVKLKEG